MWWGDWGGDEFGVMLPGASLDDAVAYANRLREILGQSSAQLNLSKSVTCSVGVAARHSGEGLDELVSRADEALYESKRQGRNRVSS